METIIPSSSSKQERFMRAVSNSKEFAAKAGVPQAVGKDFAAADEAKGAESADKKGKSRLSKLYKDTK